MKGTAKFKEVTERLNQFYVAAGGEGGSDPKAQFAIVLDDQVISAPRSLAVITDGRPQITGGFTEESAKALSDQLRFGALPDQLRDPERAADLRDPRRRAAPHGPAGRRDRPAAGGGLLAVPVPGARPGHHRLPGGGRRPDLPGHRDPGLDGKLPAVPRRRGRPHRGHRPDCRLVHRLLRTYPR